MNKRLILLVLFCSVTLMSFSQLIDPVDKGEGKYGFTCKNTYFEVDANMGGRIRSWQIDNEEYMFVDWENNSLLSGSTFWPSPQSWGWPPSTTLDSEPYGVQILDSKLVLTSDKESSNGLSFNKAFLVNEADTSVTIEYTINNNNKTAKTWAPWEITRVPQNGLTFFQKGDGEVTGNMESSTSYSNSCVWYNQNESPSGSKFFCDGKGWLAHVNNNKQFFIKVFKDIALAKAAPNEAEVEVYTSTGLKYTELENQGEYTKIEAGASFSWTVKWYLRNLPDNITVDPSSQALVDYAVSFANRQPTNVKVESMQLNVYPNPAGNSITLPENVSLKSQLNIYNSQGSEVLNTLTSSRIVNISKLDNGLYFFELRNVKNETYKGTFIVSRK